mgnify:FL=1
MDGKVPDGIEIRTLSNLIMRETEKIFAGEEDDGITATNGWIIGFLASNPDREIYQRDLEAQFSITRSTASKVLLLMEKKGLIERVSVPHDARLKKLVLTAKAREIRERRLIKAREFEETLIKGFTKAELEFLYTCIGKMKDNLS